MNLFSRVFLNAFLLFNQIPPNSPRSVSPTTQEKLRLIRKWLDTTHDATVYDYIYMVNKGAGLNLFEGDIKGHNPRHHQVRTAVTDHQLLWNTRVVPYTIDPAFDSASKKEILAGVEEFHKKTCIKFVPRRSEKDFVHIKPIGGCYSNVGRVGGEQELSLAGPCLKKGTAIHELMHALGFWHEQSRPDRDYWVQIIESNIQTGKGYNFDKLLPSEVDTLNEQYDYGSIMHYSKYAFSKNGNPTIIPIRPTDAELGQREGLSEHDVNRINKLYKCGTNAVKSTTNQVYPSQPIKVTRPVTIKNKTPTPMTFIRRTFIPSMIKSFHTTIAMQPPKIKSNASPAVIQTSLASTNTHLSSSKPITYTTTQQPVTSTKQLPSSSRPVIVTTTNTTSVTSKSLIYSLTQKMQSSIAITDPTRVTTQVSSKTPIDFSSPETSRSNPSTSVATFDASITTTAEGPRTSIHIWTPWTTWTACNIGCRQSRYRECRSYVPQRCHGNHTKTRDCSYSCEPAIPLGCWVESTKSPFIPSVEERDTTLMDSYKERTMAIRKCANYAAQNDFTVFAMFDGGMCRTGPTANLMYSKGGPSEKCTHTGTGSEDASNVYSFERDIDGGWSRWTNWSQCTKSCNIGQQYRFRRCENPPPVGNGTLCTGTRREVAVCNLQACPVNSKCGQPFYAGSPGDSGYIWVRDYDNFMECEYHIMTVDPQSTISLLIQNMDIEYSRGCIYDTLMVYDGRNSFSPFVGSFCGESSPGSFESSTNHVYLKFESDETKAGGEFTVFYTINNRSRKACVRPPPSPHVTIESEGNMVGNRVFYTCHHGYKLVGHPNITCVDQPNFALWDDVFPRCIASKKRSVDGIREETLCTFENSLCGFTSHPSSNFNWRVDQFGDDIVLVTQSSRLQAPGDVSMTISGIQNPGIDGNCLEFRYLIQGTRTAVLNVYLIQMDITKGVTNNTLLTTLHGTGRDGTKWEMAIIPIFSDVPFQIMFEAVLWEEIGSMVQIDDVRISSSTCSS